MDLWDISKDVFDNLIKDISAKAAEDEDDTTLAAAEERNILKVLPPELLGHIFQFLPQSDLFTVRLVCKKFNAAATSPQVFKLYLQERNLEIQELDVEVMQPLLKNVMGINVFYTKEEEAEILTQFFKKLEEQCTNLKILKISYGSIPANISLENIVERLSELILMVVEIKNASHFFRTTPENPVYRNLKKFAMYCCSGFAEEEAPFEGFSVAPMRNLTGLTLNDVKGLGDREYLHLKDSMVNVKELALFDTMPKLETFEQLDLRNLISLCVNQCRSDNDLLSALKILRNLQFLTIVDVNITETCAAATFKNLNKIRYLNITSCNLCNRFVASMVSHLPNLVRWVLTPAEDGNVTDFALSNLTVHDYLEVLKFDRVQLGGFGLSQIAHCAPVLRRLTLAVCAAEDDDMDVFKECFTHLRKITLTGLRITDVGLLKLEPRLSSLEKILIESRFVTGKGVASILPLLTSAHTIDIKFGEPQSSFTSSRCEDRSLTQLFFNGLGNTREVIMSIPKQLHNSTRLNFENVSLNAADVKYLIETYPTILNLSIKTCSLDEETTALIFKHSKSLTTLLLNDCHLTRNAILRLLEGIESRKVSLIMIESEVMLSEEMLLEVLPLLTTVSDVSVYTVDYQQYLSINNCVESMELWLQGMAHVNDDKLLTIMKSFYEVMNLTIVDTSVTVKGVAEIAEKLTKLTNFRIKSKVMGDETMEIIGGHFPSLKMLTVEGECVTDVGLIALGKHLESLEYLSVVHSGITDEGVKKIAPLLKCATALDLYSGNKKVTTELLAYMRETYPDIGHTEPETEEVAEGENEEAEEPVQAEEGNDAAADPGQNEVAANPVEPEEGNEVAAQPVQLQVENGEAVEPIEPEIQNEIAADLIEPEDDGEDGQPGSQGIAIESGDNEVDIMNKIDEEMNDGRMVVEERPIKMEMPQNESAVEPQQSVLDEEQG